MVFLVISLPSTNPIAIIVVSTPIANSLGSVHGAFTLFKDDVSIGVFVYLQFLLQVVQFHAYAVDCFLYHSLFLHYLVRDIVGMIFNYTWLVILRQLEFMRKPCLVRLGYFSCQLLISFRRWVIPDWGQIDRGLLYERAISMSLEMNNTPNISSLILFFVGFLQSFLGPLWL